jgi:hypothetical protein
LMTGNVKPFLVSFSQKSDKFIEEHWGTSQKYTQQKTLKYFHFIRGRGCRFLNSISFFREKLHQECS